MANSSPAGKPSASSNSFSHPNPLNSAEAEQVLRDHLALCRELLAIIERENRSLHGPGPHDLEEFTQARKSLLPRLSQAYKKLKEVGFTWQQLNSAERERHAELSALIRQNQDLIMKVVLLDRENEQAMLRRGLVPSAQLPSVNRQRPNYVAELYKGHPL